MHQRLHKRVRRELAQRHHFATERQFGGQQNREAINVKEGQNAGHNVLERRRGVLDNPFVWYFCVDLHAIGGDVVVAQHYALWQTGGARRVGQKYQIVCMVVVHN